MAENAWPNSRSSTSASAYPDTLIDLNGKELAALPHKGRWFFHDFVDTPDKRYRAIVKMFANEGYLESETDEYLR
jgi:hypothetical protein